MSTKEILVDGTYFSFPKNWHTEVFDEWPQYKKAAGALRFKGCDIVALDGKDLWIIEIKDYTYEGADVPGDLTTIVGEKAIGTMALLYTLTRRTEDSVAKAFALKCSSTTRIHLALHVEVRDGGRREKEIKSLLAPLLTKLRQTQKVLGLHKAHVSSTLAPSANVPWSARRDPTTRAAHSDR